MKILLATALLLFSLNGKAALSVFACTPEWGALAKELGGGDVAVYVATTARQDPHRIEARPSLIARARGADLVACTGAELEVGWLPLVQRQSGNARIQPGAPGYFEAAQYVDLIEKPARLDRADGDVHPAGNPHLHLDPRNVAKVAAALGERMAELDPPRAGTYRERTRAFLAKWRDSVADWERKAAPLRGAPVVVHHRNLSYLIAWLGLREVGALEPKPGIPPSGAHLATLLSRLQDSPARVVLRTPYDDSRGAEWLASKAGLPSIVLPYTVGGSGEANDLFSLFEDTLRKLMAAAR